MNCRIKFIKKIFKIDNLLKTNYGEYVNLETICEIRDPPRRKIHMAKIINIYKK